MGLKCVQEYLEVRLLVTVTRVLAANDHVSHSMLCITTA
jgi:hypothetical protein